MNELKVIDKERFIGEIPNKKLLEKALTRFGVRNAKELVKRIQMDVKHYSRIKWIEKWQDGTICVEYMGANEKEEEFFYFPEINKEVIYD